MISTVLAYLTNAFVFGAICLVVGVVFSQKIKDWISGVPSELRTAIKGVETKARADIQQATSDVLRKLPAMETPKTVAETVGTAAVSASLDLPKA